MDRPPLEKRNISCPRIVLCGLRGGSGKTVVVTGLIRALRKRGVEVAPFKKGPDYIDPQWISLAAGTPCRNLDSFFMEGQQIHQSVARHSQAADVAVIEGNRGLYDGMDDEGTYSTAELAVLLNAPVILIVDCTKTTRTVAAMVLGCKTLNPNVPIGGVILNQVARDRQEAVIRAAVEKETGIPVVGAIRRLRNFEFPERHLGLNPPTEHATPKEILECLAEAVGSGVDIDSVLRIARSAPPLSIEPVREEMAQRGIEKTVRIGVIRDEAFHFYYPENLEALQQEAILTEIDALRDSSLPSIDALYIGGGFPEMLGERLAKNTSFRESLRKEIEAGLPVIAECGGLIYLSDSVCVGEHTFPMVGVFPVTYRVSQKPQGHGYTIVQVDRENPYYPLNTEMRGHEFRYSAVIRNQHNMPDSAFRMQRGFGFDGERDGLMYKNCLASFCHHHASGNPKWAEGLINQAKLYKQKNNQSLP